MRISLDVFGGDYAPQSFLDGVKFLSPELKANDCVVLFCDIDKVHPCIDNQFVQSDKLKVHYAQKFFWMEKSPMKSSQHKNQSSIVCGYQKCINNQKFDVAY